MFSTKLYYLTQHTSYWRRAALIIHKKSDPGLALHPDQDLQFRDDLCRLGMPVEAWIDFRVIADWVGKGLPIPLIAMSDYILSKQYDDGSWSADGIVVNSGATIRSLKLCALLGFDSSNKQIAKGLHYLGNALIDGGLQSPGPVPGAPLEIGTTARCLHAIFMLQPDSPAIGKMQRYLEKALFKPHNSDLSCWHTDAVIESTDEGITGASALALHALLETGHDLSSLDRIVRWFVRMQNTDGGWSERKDGQSSVDNTFNVLRALEALPKGFKVASVEKALQQGHDYIFHDRHITRKADISSLAMLLRARLIFTDNPYCVEVMRVLNAITDRVDQWYSPRSPFYSAVLTSGLALTEWLKLATSSDGNPYARQRRTKEKALSFLLDFPVQMPSFYPNSKGGLVEKLLNGLATNRLHGLASFIEGSITFRDISSMSLSVFIFFGVYVNSDLIKTIVLPGKTFVYTTPLLFVYATWLILKWRTRPSILNFISTTLLAVIMACGLILWCRLSNELIEGVLSNIAIGNPELWRLILFFVLFIDIGKQLISRTHLDRLLIDSR